MEHLKPQHLIQEAAGKDQVTAEQYGQLHAWDVFLEDIIPQLEADKAKMHAITPFEMKQGEVQRIL